MNILSIEKGLTSQQASEYLSKVGYNELPHSKGHTTLKIFLKTLTEPMIFILIAVAVVYFMLGDTTEGIILFSSLGLVVAITFYQEQRTEKTLESLRNYASPKALVYRDANLQKIPSREVVPGDLIVLSEGDRVTADAVVLQETNLFLDESMITGESASVSKTKGKQLLSGTLVVKGDTVARVTDTGIKTEIGQIGSAIEKIEFKDSLLQKETRRIVRIMFGFALITCLLVVLFNYLVMSNFMQGVLAALTVAMSMIPEEFPVVLTIILSFGAWKLSKINVLTRRIPIIETLGAITTLCVDKTGTITENKMQITHICTDGKILDLSSTQSEKSNELFYISMLASKETPIDPMETEIHRIAQKTGNKISNDWNSIKEYPMTNKITAISKVWQRSDKTYLVAAKGSPESILDLCHLDNQQREHVLSTVHEMAQLGLRILGVAKAEFPLQQDSGLPENQEDITFSYVGLLGFEDPVKSNVHASVQECYTAGIKVMMMTGDYSETAIQVAKKIGLKESEEVINGRDLEGYSEVTLLSKINEGVSIFCRVKPLQKLNLVRALIKRGDIVAMTGDGVNDSPALKEAHVGIAMGKRGTDVAREASAIVLLDDDFNSIVKGIKMGRKIYENIKKSMRYVFSVHFPIAGMALIPVALGMPNFFYPLHILFLEFLIDPISTIVFETEKSDKHLMKRPPRKIDEKIFTKDTMLVGVIEGFVMFAAAFIVYKYALAYQAENYARTLGFITLVAGNLSLVLINISVTESWVKTIFRPNLSLAIIYASAITILIASIYIPIFSEVFKFYPVSVSLLLLAFLIGFFSVASLDFVRGLLRRTHLS